MLYRAMELQSYVEGLWLTVVVFNCSIDRAGAGILGWLVGCALSQWEACEKLNCCAVLCGGLGAMKLCCFFKGFVANCSLTSCKCWHVFLFGNQDFELALTLEENVIKSTLLI